MKLIDKLKNVFKKEYKPEDFRLKITESWFSPDFVYIQYSRNKGRTWKIIHTAKDTFIGYNLYEYKWDRLTFPLGNGDFTEEKKQFSSYEKIKEYEDSQYKKMIEENKKREMEREEKRKERIKAYKRANS